MHRCVHIEGRGIGQLLPFPARSVKKYPAFPQFAPFRTVGMAKAGKALMRAQRRQSFSMAIRVIVHHARDQAGDLAHPIGLSGPRAQAILRDQGAAVATAVRTAPVPAVRTPMVMNTTVGAVRITTAPVVRIPTITPVIRR